MGPRFGSSSGHMVIRRWAGKSSSSCGRPGRIETAASSELCQFDWIGHTVWVKQGEDWSVILPCIVKGFGCNTVGQACA